MEPIRKTLAISSLLLDPQNPRLEIKNDDRETFEAMVAQQGELLLNLVKDIGKQGFMEIGVIIVTPASPSSKKYIVLEGNRRISSLRILANPDILEGTALENKISSLKKFVKNAQPCPTEVNCLVFSSRANAMLALNKIHSGPDKGRGLVPWGSIEKRRFHERFTKAPDRIISLLDFLFEKNVPIPESFPVTNLERLLGTPAVREKIGLVLDNGQYSCNIDEQSFINNMLIIIHELSQSGSVNKIRNVNDRKQFVDSLKLPSAPKIENWSITNKSPLSELQNEKVPPVTEASTKSTRKSNKTSHDRNTLIDRHTKYSLPADKPRLNYIYNELKKLNISMFPNAVAVLFRVFLELSVEFFIQNNGIQTSRECKDMKLREKLIKVKEYLKNNGLDDKDLKGLNVAISDKDNIASIDTFNAYVHNSSFNPDPQSLKTAWDNLLPLFNKIWNS